MFTRLLIMNRFSFLILFAMHDPTRVAAANKAAVIEFIIPK